MIRDDYAKVGVPMLPVVAGDVVTARQIWLYTLILVPSTFLLVYPLHVTGAIYGGIAVLLASVLIKKAWALLQNPVDKQLARSLFLYCNFYMMLLCTGMVIDSLPITHRITTAMVENLQTLLGAILSSQ